MRRLGEKSFRLKAGLHLIEGERLVFDALASNASLDTLLIEEGKAKLIARAEELNLPYLTVTRSVLEAVSDTKSPQGIAASIRTPRFALPAVFGDGLYAALDTIQDPGNLGTIIRTADAMGACGVILGRGCTDAFSPKALRSAMGSTYHIPIYEAELAGLLPRLTGEGFTAICGHLQGSEGLPSIGRKCVIVVGNEGSGVSDEIAGACTLCRLPMYGRAESLNASVAASIMIFEAARAMHSGE